MKTILKTTLTHLFVTAAIFAGSAAFAKWDIVTSTDPMTDAVTYSIGTFGDEYAISEYTKATPSLIVRITPSAINSKNGQITAEQNVIIDFEPDGIRRTGTTAIVRFDKTPAEQWPCNASTDRRAAFIDKPIPFIARLKKSKDLYYRFETTLGAVRTLHFSTADLTAAIEEVKKRIRATSKKTP